MSSVFTWPSQSVTATNPSVGVNNTAIPASSTQIAGKSPSNLLRPVSVDESGELQVNVTDSVLPTGAATEATLLQVDSDIQAGNVLLTAIEADTTAAAASLASIDGKLANPMPVTGPLTDAQLRAAAVPVSGPLTDTELRASAVPVTASSLPLPSGAATEAKQDVGNASLASIDSDIDVALSTRASEATLSAVSAQLPATLGQKAMAASLAVVLASDQSVIPVSIAAIPAQSGRSVVTTVRNDYSSTNVTTGAWVQLVASLASAVNMIEIFDSSGQTLELGIGAPASETRLILVFPGGNGQVPVSIGSGTRLSIRAVSATANAGELDINLYS